MTSLQDRGRIGHQRFGVSPAGAMDPLALAVANALVGNPLDTAAIEMAVFGAALKAEGGSVRVALAGAEMALEVGGEPVPPLASVTLREGERLTIRSARSGVFAYLAVAGGFDVPPDLGSLSHHARSGLGPKRIESGTRLAVAGGEPSGPERQLVGGLLPASTAPLAVILGPQDDYFSKAGIATFLSATYTISTEADRMGYRLTGPKIEHEKGFNIVSDAIVTGSIQVPGSGEPIVLMTDRQTTGGYPKIAVVTRADLPRLAQMRPGSTVRFTAVSRTEAVERLRAEARRLAEIVGRISAAGADLLASERLLGLNLAGDAAGVDHH
ncbi:MAG TPA: biotin-dependent carboxyltransferase family protein [Hyphomicrobiaceae bacterium]|nr:biotin-dependent carboxyltransferase family protein [Hyphomicrobiaceae bacterium]